MNLKIIVFPLMLLPLLTVKTCGCDKETPKPTYLMTQEFKDYTFFPQGSWWVFEDSVTAEIDSITVTSTDNYILEPEQLSFNSETYRMNLKSTFYNLTHRQIGAIPQNYRQVTNVFYLPVDSADTLFFFHSSISINNLNYDSVSVYKASGARSAFVPDKAYWKRGIGMVKKVMSDGRVWELKEYYINR